MPNTGGRCGRVLALVVGLALPAVPVGPPVAAADRSVCKYFSQLPDDCADARQRRFDHLKGTRFEEIDLYARDVVKKLLYVSIYNTTGQNGGDDTGDSAPESFASNVDPAKVAKRFQALAVKPSPPRRWAIDWLTDRVGAVRNFDGLDAAWMGNGPASEARLAAKAPAEAYRVLPFPRTAIEGFRKGTEIDVLDDPKGRVWVLVAYVAPPGSGDADDALASLGDRLRLPAGWTFRTVTLGRDLVLEAKAGNASAIEDEAGDVYHLAGAGQSNFTP